MRLKSSVWWAISIVLFIASAYFWNYAEKKREADHAKWEKAHAVAMPKAPAHAPLISSGPAAASKTNAVTAKPTPSSFRVSNTTRPLAELQRNSRAVLLRNALIDTTKPLDDLKIPAQWRAKGEPGSYIVQLDHPLDKAFYDALKAVGAKFVSYIPNNAALIVASASVAKQLPYSTLAYEPYYKADPKIITGASATNQFFRITGFSGGREGVAKAISQAGGEIVAEENMVFGPSLIARVDSGRLVDIAQSGAVQALEPAVPRARLNDLTRETLGVAADSTTSPNYLNLTGSNVVINVNDSGVDAGHPDLTNRVAGDFAFSLNDFDGHGTHVAGIIAGDGSMSTNVTLAVGSTSVQNPPPNYFPLQFHGKAPRSVIYAQSIDIFGSPFITDTYLQTNAASQTNLHISNNSWGYIGADPYSMPTASYDAAVRDALPGTTGSQPILYVFAAGNEGVGDDSGLNAFPDTILAPAAGKNVISVGAVESFRNITNTIVYQDGTNFITNAVWTGMTDSANEVAAFSSRGNVGIGVEGDFGRFKPDVVAPGVFIVSTRSTNWTDPTNFLTADVHNFPDQSVGAGATNTYTVAVPNDAVQMDISTIPNGASPNPFPALEIYADSGTAATTLRGKGQVAFPISGGTTWTIDIKDTTTQPVAYDLQIFVVRTNSFGTYFQELKKLNDGLGKFYRYESGTSMAAPAVTGVLALMEDYLKNRLGLTASPALMKAMLINGARTLGNLYDFSVRRDTANDQGWGLVNLPNSIPANMTPNQGPVVFFDQSVSNALATGQSRTWNVTPTDPYSPMRLTLVWTDPPGNPAAGVKLVNDLDIIVTNLETGEVFVGNNFQDGDVFTRADDPVFGPVTDADTVNNVENIYLFGALGAPLGSNYTVTVRGSHVNVNAVTEHPDNIVQDYALVISGGTRPTVNNSTPDFTPSRLLTVASNSVPLLYQRVGANSPLISTPGTGLTNGTISQWHFFVFTNNVDFTKTNATNVAFVTFLPPNLSQSRLEEPPGVAPRNDEFGADIDLYVSSDPRLLDLDPNVIAASDKSTLRGGTEFVTYTNSFSNAVYYVGVKSEDQQAAEFGFFAVATDKPFGGLDADGQLQMYFSGLPAVIPDGYPALPSKPPVIAIAVVVPTSDPKATVRRLVISQSITHELLGDLYGTLMHNGRTVVLNNHTLGHQQQNVTNVIWTYDDLDEGDVVQPKYPGHFENGAAIPKEWIHTDGPGSLKDFVDKRALGVWIYTMTDNALNNTGQVNVVQGWIEPNPATNVLHQIRKIAANGWFYDFLDLPDDVTNLNIAVTYQAGTGPVDIYLRKNFFPTPTNYDAAALNIGSPGGALNLNISNSPPISGGFWIYGIHNTSGTEVTIAIDITITRSLTPDLVQTVTNKTGTVLLDNAITTSQILISNALPVVSVEVGLRLDHPRLSDLSIKLISPQGTHVMLYEDRGYTNATAFGLDDGTNNTVYTIFTEDTNRASQLIKFALPPYAAISTLATNLPLFQNGFETAAPGTYVTNTTAEGWTVVTNEAAVVADSTLANSGTNFLALGSAEITRFLPTAAGKNYLLSHSYRGAGIINWWPGEGNANDVIGTNNGVFTNVGSTTPALYVGGEVGKAFHFDGTDTAVTFDADVGNFRTSDFTVELWFRTQKGDNMPIIAKRQNCNTTPSGWNIMIGYVNGTQYPPGTLGFEIFQPPAYADGPVVPNVRVDDGLWHHVALTRIGRLSSFYLDGVMRTNILSANVIDLNNPHPMQFGRFVCEGGASVANFHPFDGSIDEVSFYNRALSDAEIYDIFAAGSRGKRTTLSVLPNISYMIDGATNDTLVSPTGGPWQTNTIGFTATNNVTQFAIQGNPLGMLLDDITLTELPNTNYANYFFPEESLSAFNGELASGFWTLEIHDARGGQAGKLLDWELNLTYSSTNVNMITVVPGTNNCATAPAGGYAYFAIDVPPLAKFATNTLITAGPNPLDVIFNQTSLPTGYSPGDFYLMANVGAPGAIAVLSKNSGPPFLVPGQRYFLAVQNLTAQDQPFCLQVDFDVNTNFDITSLDDPNPNPVATNVLAGSVQYYYYDIATNSVTASFEILNPSDNVDIVISHTLPLPDSQRYDYGGFNAGTNDDFIVVRTNSSPVPLTPGRWYITVYNSETNTPTVTYTIRAQQSVLESVVFDLVDGQALPGEIADPGFSLDSLDELRYYRLTISNTPAAVEFVISNLNGNCDLLARLGSFPTSSQFDYASFNPGTTTERLVISTNSSLPSLNGSWYLAIPNNDPGIVNFDIAGTTLANPTLPFPSIVAASASFTPGPYGAFSFTWDSVAGQNYYIDSTTNLVDWTNVGAIRAQSSTTTFNQASPTGAARYYRVRPQ